MKDADIERRLEKLEGLQADLKARRTLQRKMRNHIRSSYYRDGLAGRHPYLDLAPDRETYLERHATFAGAVSEKISALMAESRTLPAVSDPRWDTRRQVRIAIIADRFLFDSLKDAAEVVPVGPTTYAEDLDGADLFLVTSAWRGLDGEWTNIGDERSASRRVLDEKVIPHARRSGIPVVYYSKEDPPNYAKFASLAQSADHVFTTAAECVSKYQEELATSVPVDVLPFGVNHFHHNPMGSTRHSGRELMFAGSWFNHKYLERRTAAQRIFDGLIDAGADLMIVDRNLDLDPSKFANAERYLFPERYLPYLHGPLDHDDLLGLQRLLPLAINLNSVTSSQTMFANRVIELQAMGTMIVSNYSAGVNSLYPHVAMPDSRVDARQLYEALTPLSIRDAQAAGVRAAFTDGTAFDRIDQLVEAIGLSPRRPQHRVLVGGRSRAVVEQFIDAQIFSGELVPVFEDSWASARGSQDGDLLVRVDDSQSHGPNVVQDLVNAFRYSDADCAAARPLSTEGLFEYGGREVLTGSAASALWLEPGESVADAEFRSTVSVTVPSSFAHPARERVAVAASPEISIVVPVYNNGEHLKYKCFESLRRSSVFNRSEILLVDDGSTDPRTHWIIEALAAEHENVRVHRFAPGGSGSASRPRNKGLELARAPFVTYLDPDNEQTNDGFAVLLEDVRDNDLDFSIGNMVRFKAKRAIVNNHGVLRHVVEPDGTVIEGALSKANYQPMSIQALVARTDWLRSTGIYQPEGAVGQDSYFFQQMLFHARRIGIRPLPIHTYYAAVSNSTVNTVSPRFFEKYVPLEEHRSAWLRSVGLLEDYNERRLEKFVKGWYLQKLQLVNKEDQPRSVELIHQLVAYFDKQEWKDPELAAFFVNGRAKG